MNLSVKKLSSSATIPTYGSLGAAGLDLYANENSVIIAHTRAIVSTGIAIEWYGKSTNLDNQIEEIPSDYYLRLAPRSGLSVKNSIDIGAGVIDCDYRGEIKVCLINNGENDFVINKGDRICQGILEKIKRFETIKEVAKLGETDRGEGGFGSTGK